MASSSIKGITIEIGGETTKLDSALKSVNTTTKTLQAQLKAVDQALKLDPTNTELLAEKQEVLAAAISTTKEKLETLKTAQEQAEKAFANGDMGEDQYRALQTEIMNTETYLKRLESQLDDEKDAFQKAADAVKEAGETLEKTGEKISKVGDSMESVGKALTPVTAAITAVGTASVAASVDFEDAIAKLSTIADTTEETGVPLEELEQQIKDLSNETGIAASEIADNVYNAISAGQETGDAVNFVAQSTKLATAGFADSGDALDLLTTILNAYGMEASEVNHVSDVLISTQNKGKTTVAELSSAMGKVIPTANASNVSLENLAAAYAVMTSNGIATAESTTYMNSMINELAKSGSTASDTLKNETGKSFSELMESGYSLADVLAILEEQATEDGLALSDMFSSSEAGKAALTILSGGVDDFNASVEEMTNGVEGATDEAFAKLDTTSRQVSIALNEVKNAGIELGDTILDMLTPYLEKLADIIKNVTSWFSNLNDGQKETIVKIGALVAAISPALLIGSKVVNTIGSAVTSFGNLMTKASGLIGSLGKVKTAFSALFTVISANPIVAIIAAIVAVIAILVTLYNKCEWFRNAVDAIFAAIKDAFFAAWDKITEFFTETLPDMIDDAVSFFSNLWDDIVAIFQGAGSWFSDRFTEAYNGITSIFKGIGQWFSGRWTDIKNALSGVATWFSTMFQNAYTNVTNAFKNIGSWFSGRWTDIKNALSAVATWFSTMFQNAYTNVTNAFKNIGSWFSGRWTDIKNALSNVGSWFSSTFQTAYSNVTSAFSGIGSWFQTNVIGAIQNAFNNFSLADAGTRIANSFVNAIKSVHIPSLSISWGEASRTIGNLTISVPVPSISWNALGGIMTDPTLFGLYGGKLQGGGEAGDEAILPLDIFYKRTEGYIDDAIARATAAAQSGGKSGGNFVQNISIESPEALSAYEVARQTRNQTRNLVLQLQKG